VSWLFWALSALLIAAVALLLTRVLWRPASAAAVSTEAANLAVYRQRSRELEEEVATGLLSVEAAEQARAELDHQLLEDTAEAREAGSSEQGTGRAMALGVLVLVPLIALAAYLSVRPDPSLLAMAGTPDAVAQADAGQLSQMADNLHQRLAVEPDDGLGWLVLGRVYMALEDIDAAVTAFEQAVQHLETDPRPLVDYAEARAAQADGPGWDAQGRALLEQALQLDPEQPKALWLAGVAAVEQGDLPAARTYWQRLLEQMPEDSDVAELLRAQIRGLQPETDGN